MQWVGEIITIIKSLHVQVYYSDTYGLSKISVL